MTRWDQSNWSIGHEPIEASPFANKWPLNSPLMRGAWRVHGKPFTYSEWNIGEPSVPSAGAVPIMSMLGALQDWDAMFFFDYEDKGGVWDSDRLDGYFRFNSQPCKLALLGPFGQVYRNGDLTALTDKHASAEGAQQRDGVHGFTKLIGLDPNLPRVEGHSPPSHKELATIHPPLLETPDGTASWDARDAAKATMRIDSPNTKAIGGLIGGQSARLGDWEIEFGTVPRDYGVFIAVSRDGKPLSQSDSILVTAVNHAENSVMNWNETGNSVSDQWGDGPTITWGVPAKLTLPQRDQTLVVYAINSEGKREVEIATNVASGKVTIELGPEHRTLMYEITTRQSN